MLNIIEFSCTNVVMRLYSITLSHQELIPVCTHTHIHSQAELTKQQNEFKIKLKELEDSLLSRLSSAGGNFLGDTSLVENLETTKRTATEVQQKVSVSANLLATNIYTWRQYNTLCNSNLHLIHILFIKDLMKGSFLVC